MKTEEQEAAIIAAEKAVKMDSGNAETYVELGMTYFHAERFKDAMDAFQQAITLNPNAAHAYNGIGRVRYHTGPAQAAIEAYERAIDLDRNYIDPYYGLGILYSPSGPIPRRLRRKKGFGACPEVDTFHLHLKRYEDAITACRREIELADNHSARRLLGYLYGELARYDEAIDQLERSVALEPEDYEARAALARIYRTVGNEQKAAEHYAIAAETAWRDDEYGQACFEAVNGNLDKAIALLEVALKTGQVQAGWVRIDPEFAFIQDDPRFRALIDGSGTDRTRMASELE